MPDPIDRNKPFAVPGPYITSLGQQDESKFQDWVKTNKVPFDPSPNADYDMRGYWKDIASKGSSETSINPVDKQLHFPDTYKTPYHESFSNESKYATPDNPFKWEGETLKDSRTGKPVYETKPMPDDNKIPLEPWVSDYIDKTGQVPTMHIFLNPHETGNPESKPANQAPPSAYPDIEADHTQQKVQDQHIATGVFSPEDAKPEDLEAAQTASAFGWSKDTELKLMQMHKLVNQAGEAAGQAVPSSMAEVTEHPIVSALKTAGFAMDPVAAVGATLGGTAINDLVDKHVPAATNPILHPMLKTAGGVIGSLVGGSAAGGIRNVATSSILDEAGNPILKEGGNAIEEAQKILSPEEIELQRRGHQAMLESAATALKAHLAEPDDAKFQNLAPGTVLNAENYKDLSMKTNIRVDNITKAAQAYMKGTTPAEKEAALNILKEQIVPTANLIKSGVGVTAEHGRALSIHNTDWSAVKDVQGILGQQSDQDWDTIARALSSINPSGAATKSGKISSFLSKLLSGGNVYKALVNAQLMNPRIAAEKIATDVIYQPYNITMQAIATAARFKSLSAGAKVWTGGMKASFDALPDAWRFAKATVRSGAPEFEKTINEVNDPRIFAEDYGDTIPGKTANWLSSAFGIGTRTVVGADQFAKTVAYRAELHTQAFYRAMQDAENLGLSGSQAYRQALTQSEAYMKTMPGWLERAAESNMGKDTFTDEDAYTQGAKAATDAIPALKLVAPFLRTPINLLENGMMSTPAAPLTAKFWSAMSEGGLSKNTALTKLAVGSSLWGWMVHEAAKGNIIGSPPSDPSMRETFMKQYGEGEGIVHGNSIYSVKHLGPIGDMLIHAANYAHYMAQMPPNDYMGYGTAAVQAMAKIASNAPLLEPLMNTMSALGEGLKSEEAGKGIGKPLAKLGGRIAASFIPAPLKIAADAASGYTRDTNNAWDAIKNRLPGNGMPPHRDQWGEPQFLSPGAGPNDEGPAWYESVMNSISPLPIYHGRELDAVEKEQMRVNFKASRAPNSLYASDPRLPIPIDPETKDRWAVLAGKELKLRPILGAGGPMNQHDNIETMINNKNYQDIATQYRDPEIAKAKQAQEIEKIHRMYMEQARKQLLNERPDLAVMAVRRQALETPRAGAANVGAN